MFTAFLSKNNAVKNILTELYDVLTVHVQFCYSCYMRHVSTGLQADRLVTIAFILGKQNLPLIHVGFDRLKGCGK